VIFAAVLFITTETYLYNRENSEHITAWQTDLSALQTLESLQQLLWRVKKAEGNFLLTRKREYAEQAQSSLTEFQEELSRWKDDETGNELLNSTRQYEQLFATMVNNISRNRLTRGRQIALELSELGDKIQGTIAAMSQRRQADLFSQIQASQRLTVGTARTIWVAALLVLIAILFYAIVSARKVTRPVRQITDVLQKALSS
jgi:CHASE3 domain sensor protein